MRIQNPNESIHRRARNSERVAMLVVQNIQLPCISGFMVKVKSIVAGDIFVVRFTWKSETFPIKKEKKV